MAIDRYPSIMIVMKKCDVIIIGAGAAGLMCAIEASKRGRSTIVLDHANKPGKKILMSGGGRCNFTNVRVESQHFISHNPHFCKSALHRYTPQHFINLVEKHEVPYYEKHLGQLFCVNKSKDILNILLHECEKNKADVFLNTSITSISQGSDLRFTLQTTRENFNCESLVIATGGLSIPTMGATGFGYNVAKQFGINVWPTRAGLVPFTLHPHDKESLACLSGIAAPVTASCNQQAFNDDLLFTHRGLSGPAMLQISSYWQPGDTLSIDFFPEQNLLENFKQAQCNHPGQTLKTWLSALVAKRQATQWLGTLADRTLANCSNKQILSIIDQLKRWTIKPNNTEGYRTAEVTLGGVDCNALSSKTFEANNTCGLYFIGEVCDVSGWLGGYNFQWAWSSGYAAGQAV